MESIENEWAQQETPLLDIEMRRTWLYHTSKWMTMLNIDTHAHNGICEKKGPNTVQTMSENKRNWLNMTKNEGKTYKAKRDDGKCCRTTLWFWPSLQKRWLTDRAETRIWQAFNIRHKPNLLHMYSIGKGYDGQWWAHFPFCNRSIFLFEIWQTF